MYKAQCLLVDSYSRSSTEVLTTIDQTSDHIESYTTSVINDDTIIACCLEIMQKSVYQFEKRITRATLKGKSKKSNELSKKPQVLYSDLPEIPPIETWKGIQL